jgi:hypothetical protein
VAQRYGHVESGGGLVKEQIRAAVAVEDWKTAEALMKQVANPSGLIQVHSCEFTKCTHHPLVVRSQVSGQQKSASFDRSPADPYWSFSDRA